MNARGTHVSARGYSPDVAKRGAALGVVALIAVASACSSDADADPQSTASESITSEPDTAATIETDPPTTPAPTTAAPATDAPTTTVDEAEIIAEVEAAYFASFDAYHEAILEPTNPALKNRLSDLYVDEGQTFVVGILDDLVRSNRIAKPHSVTLPQTVITGPVRFEDEGRTEASLVACQINPEAFYEVGGGPDGEDALLRDDVIRVDAIVLMRVQDGRWLNAGGDITRDLAGVETCDEL